MLVDRQRHDQQRGYEGAPRPQRLGGRSGLADLKVQTDGGSNMPLLCFGDDTNGLTTKVSVGSTGPHRDVRNTRS